MTQKLRYCIILHDLKRETILKARNELMQQFHNNLPIHCMGFDMHFNQDGNQLELVGSIYGKNNNR